MKFFQQKNEEVYPVRTKSSNGGYIALMSVIIISLILLAFTAVLSMSGYFSRFNVLAGEYKRVSLGLAESCVNVALLKIAQGPTYQGNETVPVGANNCNIKQVSYHCDQPCDLNGYNINTHQKIANIATWAQYPLINGAFSNLEISATVQDPNFSPPSKLTIRSFVYGGTKLPGDFAPYKVGSTTVVLDTATIFPSGNYLVTQINDSDYNTAFSADCDSTGYVNIGFNENKTCVIVNIYKSKTANLTVIADIVNPYGTPKPASDFKLYIDGIELKSGQSKDLSTESGLNDHKVAAGSDPDYTAGDWSLPCAPNGDITLYPGDSPKACKVIYTKNAPPSPSCADTVMMLDRTGSMFTNPQWIADEKTAAKGLLDLYSPLSPRPKVGIGRFADSSKVNADIVAHLTTDYTGLYNIIDNSLFNNQGYTNLSDAIFDGHNELVSVVDDLEKVLILISDGIPNRPGCSGSAACLPAMNSATANANMAKSAETQIYTIHFGETASVPGTITSQDFLASLANNSAVDHFLNTDTGFKSPSSQSSDTGGDNNGFESNPANAFSDGGGYASNMNGAGDRHRFYNYNFNLPANTVINGIEVRLDWWLDSTYGTNSMSVQLSWDGGTNWTSLQTNSAESTSDTNNKILGSPTNTWGRTWSASNFTNSNFRLRVVSNSNYGTRDFFLDWVPIKIYYTSIDAVAENADGDNFYISPTSADMANIFEDIGKAVCPAAGGPVTPPTPSPPTITVITEIFNNYGGSKQPADATINIPTAVDPNQRTLPGKTWPGDTITVAEGAYNITGSDLENYTKSSDCAGTITAGSNQTCKITYNQKAPSAPPLPPPPPNIIIDIWKETP